MHLSIVCTLLFTPIIPSASCVRNKLVITVAQPKLKDTKSLAVHLDLSPRQTLSFIKLPLRLLPSLYDMVKPHMDPLLQRPFIEEHSLVSHFTLFDVDVSLYTCPICLPQLLQLARNNSETTTSV